ncbi:MAG: hypothetical protein ACRCZ8_14470 [Aeromonas sobria]
MKIQLNLIMPSCSDMTGYRERVAPDDGRNENRWVAIFTIALLLCGVVGIWLRQEPATPVVQTPQLTPSARQQLTELTIALDEARFMASDGRWPALTAMAQAQIPPFHEGDWQELANGCWLGPSPGHADGRWLLSLPANAIFMAGEGVSGTPDCTTPTHWISMTP